MLTVVLLVVSSVTLCNAGCHSLEIIPGLRGCIGYGIFVPFGFKVEPEPCLVCECGLNGIMSCCEMKVRFSYPQHCKEIPDGQCRTKIVMKNDPSMLCDSFGGVGK